MLPALASRLNLQEARQKSPHDTVGPVPTPGPNPSDHTAIVTPLEILASASPGDLDLIDTSVKRNNVQRPSGIHMDVGPPIVTVSEASSQMNSQRKPSSQAAVLASESAQGIPRRPTASLSRLRSTHLLFERSRSLRTGSSAKPLKKVNETLDPLNFRWPKTQAASAMSQLANAAVDLDEDLDTSRGYSTISQLPEGAQARARELLLTSSVVPGSTRATQRTSCPADVKEEVVDRQNDADQGADSDTDANPGNRETSPVSPRSDLYPTTLLDQFWLTPPQNAQPTTRYYPAMNSSIHSSLRFDSKAFILGLSDNDELPNRYHSRTSCLSESTCSQRSSRSSRNINDGKQHNQVHPDNNQGLVYDEPSISQLLDKIVAPSPPKLQTAPLEQDVVGTVVYGGSSMEDNFLWGLQHIGNLCRSEE